MIIKRPPVRLDDAPEAATYLHVATFVPIQGWRDVLKSFRMSNQVEVQLKKTSGIAAYSLATDLLRRHFWTYSVWSDRAAVAAFVSEQPHQTAVERFRDWAAEGAAFVEWESPQLKLDWSEAFKRLKQPTYHYVRPS